MSSPPSTPHPTWPGLVLGSTSRYRAELLRRLGLPFTTRAPQTDETALDLEAPRDTAVRLALLKARAAASASQADEVVIGSDQVADLDGLALGKPGTHERAVAQLQAMRGHSVLFHTAVAVVRPHTGFEAQAISTVRVVLRDLSDEQIETYLRLEQPYDCAGSAKVEGLGTVLLDRVESDDPSALIGLPLIPLARMLTQAGLDPLTWHAHAATLPHHTP
jgi:septum formation protein